MLAGRNGVSEQCEDGSFQVRAVEYATIELSLAYSRQQCRKQRRSQVLVLLFISTQQADDLPNSVGWTCIALGRSLLGLHTGSVQSIPASQGGSCAVGS